MNLSVHIVHANDTCSRNSSVVSDVEHLDQGLLRDVDVVVDQQLLIHANALAHETDEGERAEMKLVLQPTVVKRARWTTHSLISLA